IGAASVPGDAHDKSGLNDAVEGGVPHDRLGSHGSAIAWSGAGSRYFMLADRGPGDGAANFKTRFHEVEIAVDPSAKPSMRGAVVKTVLLKDGAGANLVGSAAALGSEGGKPALRFAPEGIRVGPAGTLFVSDEYGPVIAEFGLDGVRRRLLAVPPRFAGAPPSAHASEEREKNARGRVPNRGVEGLAIPPA